jgi:DnaJ-class molecular chaperone
MWQQEREMVCAVCNGKGYVFGRGCESTCSECQGRGEYFFVTAMGLKNRSLENAANPRPVKINNDYRG